GAGASRAGAGSGGVSVAGASMAPAPMSSSIRAVDAAKRARSRAWYGLPAWIHARAKRNWVSADRIGISELFGVGHGEGDAHALAGGAVLARQRLGADVGQHAQGQPGGSVEELAGIAQHGFLGVGLELAQHLAGVVLIHSGEGL